LGVDRLDYTKGLVARLKALEYMFTAYPNWIGKVAMLQVAVPSRFVYKFGLNSEHYNFEKLAI
jgi:trehalose-6-phosphate synthase